MRIGEFAKKNDMSIDTIRHYMSMGLLIPEKNASQYIFDLICQNSLDELLKLKNMGFALAEIKTIFLFKLLGNHTDYQLNEYYPALFANKHNFIVNEIDNLNIYRQRLEDQIQILSNFESKKNFTLGIDISSLHILKCAECSSKLTLSQGEIVDN